RGTGSCFGSHVGRGLKPGALLLGRAGQGPRRLLDLDGGAVVQLTDRRERTDDHAVALFQPSEDFEVLVAGDTGPHRPELRLVVADDEHALELLARLSGLELRRLQR